MACHRWGYSLGIIGTQPSLQENLLLKKMKQDLEVKVRRTVDISELPAAARVYDAVLAAAYGLHSLISHQHFSAPSFPPGVCSNATVNHWNDGKELFRSILEIQNVKGLQGNLEFNDFGFYSNIAYSLVNLETTGFTEIGNWTMSHGFEELKITSAPLFPGEIKSPPGDAVYELTNKTIRVVVLEEPPFVMKNQEYDPKDPQSQRYIGYCMDLLMELQTLFNFQYTLYEVRQYGRKHPITKRWNGLVKELLDDRADIAVTSFTISHEREKVITFTKPFFDLGQTILLPRRNLQVSNTLFAFLSPFDTLLWMLIIISTVGASLATYFCQNFTPDNYQKGMLSSIHKSHCPVAKMNQATGIPLSEALWLGFSSLVNQTIDPGFINFSSPSCRRVWWFTNVVLISAYTAKLAAVFTSERLVTEIKSIEDLVTQGAIDYGTVENSVVHEFFATHQMELFRIAFQNMRNKDTFVHTAGDGIKRVRQTSSIPLGASGRYAFIFDSPVLDFASQQEPCNTETVGLFAPQNYGFGLQKDSPYEEKFSLGILKLKKEGFFEMLYERWFKGICSHVIASQGKSENYQLAFNAMIGVFSCLSGGIGISLLVVAGSWLVIYMKEMRKEKKRRMRVYPDNCSYPTERLDREEAIWASVTGRQ
ncbi:glutamate receptor 2-like [Tachypleus tridentatus]|uniref:glutamate receptor 2-like n=1 Tax=Tachypleus tridentatus TaxID=6853 RepID=UPI003FD4A657